MSKYTTGEIAKLCGVTVRTVQYYDTRGILIPSELTEGGRRLYSEDDLKKMKTICFLRSLDFSIDNIAILFREENTNKVISLLIEQQEQMLLNELEERKKKLSSLTELKSMLKNFDNFSVESIGDVVHIMENKKKLKRIHFIMFAVGIPLEIIEAITFIIAVTKGIWLPFIVGLIAEIIFAVIFSKFYCEKIAYICPECHNIFKCSLKKSFFSDHTPNTRKLTCPHCGKKSFCVETYNEEVNTNA